MNRYDAIVIGGGPAGAMFARKASSAGLIVLVVDGQAVSRPKPCGGLLAPDAQKALASFDLTLPKSILVDPQIFSVKTIDVERDLVRYYSRFYMNMDREKFDRWLVSLVPETVERISARCSAIERGGESFRLKLNRGG